MASRDPGLVGGREVWGAERWAVVVLGRRSAVPSYGAPGCLGLAAEPRSQAGGCVGPGLGLDTWWPRSSLKSAVTSGFFTDFFGLDCPPVHPSLCSHLTFPQQTHQSVFHSALPVSVLSSVTFCMILASSGNSSYHLFIFLTALAGFVLRNSRQGWAESSFCRYFLLYLLSSGSTHSPGESGAVGRDHQLLIP